MKKKKSRYPDDMDRDMIPICDALNSLNGVRTFFCCSGHGRGNPGEFYIYAGCSNMKSLKRIVRGFDIWPREAGAPYLRKRYVIELDHCFWPLKEGETGVRISNHCVDSLKYRQRKREFDRVIAKLRGNAKR